MGLKMNGRRLLADALKDAMDRDLADVPPRGQLEKQHRFSRKFVRRMKKIEAGKAGAEDFRKLFRLAKRYSSLAAVLVCAIGLAAAMGMAGSFFQMGASKGDGADMAEEACDNTAPSDTGAESSDAAAPEEIFDEEEAAGEIDSDGTDMAPAEGKGDADGLPKEPMAPGWQEQLLAESARADELAAWRFHALLDGRLVELESSVAKADNGSKGQRAVRISGIFEVYYENGAGEWERVYHTGREMSSYEPGQAWTDGYVLADLNMGRSGSYRLVRQVGNYRQVLELSLD